MVWPASLVLLLWTLAAGRGHVPATLGPVTEVYAIEGGRALIPCDVTAPTPGDSPILVLFYNGATGMPIYSIDARTRPLSRSLHWSELGKRAHFDLGSPEAGLVLEDVAAKDHGLYRCRVDFGISPTRNVRVKLLVVVPPRRVSILGGSGLEVSGVIGPYPLGGSLTLTCHATAGWPRPRVTWWHGDSLLDDVVDEVRGQVTRNILVLPSLTREDLHRALTCRASNSNLTPPLTASVSLDMTFPPLVVGITGGDEPLREGQRYSLVCQAAGSRPPADLTWWLDGVRVIHTNYQVLQEGNVSRSTLALWPSTKHNGAVVSCRADNPMLQAAALEDATKLLVYYSPRLQLQPGQNLDLTTIKEGDDVYFDCHIQANPRISGVQWFLNGRELRQNVSGGVIQSNQSLVLQSVQRTSSGLYICRANNLHGSASSNALQLSVKYAPVCAAGQKWVYGGSRLHPVNVTCRVEAYPEAVRFRWAFNTSNEFMEIPQDHIHSSRSRSLLTYTPETHHDFGSLLCWGLNDVDLQREPCVFHVVPAGVPEPVNNCSAWQRGSGAGQVVVVACQAGWGGGLPQTFTLEVRQSLGPGPATPHNSTGPASPHSSTGPVAPHSSTGPVPASPQSSTGPGPASPQSSTDPASPHSSTGPGPASPQSSTSPKESSVLQGFTGPTRLVKALRDRPEPQFTVAGLVPGREYHLAIVAANAHGSAPPAVLVHLTPIDVAEKRTSAVVAEATPPDPRGALVPIMGGVAGVVASLAVCSLVLVLVIRARTTHAHTHAHTSIIYDHPAPITEGGDDGGFLQQQQQQQPQQGPDVILIKTGGRRSDVGLQEVPNPGDGGNNYTTDDPGSCCDSGVMGWRETDALQQTPTSATGVAPPTVEAATTALLDTHSITPLRLHNSDPFPPFWSWGFGSSKDFSLTGCRGSQEPQVQPDESLYAADLAETPLLTCGHRGTHETSV
ncbi:uncharacterized protein [Panulirus ornatus]|uniref:uncharacterized protein n=1 Tax=Panulirus ornatus TaxID=150431 RepID=UPI003A8B47BB